MWWLMVDSNNSINHGDYRILRCTHMIVSYQTGMSTDKLSSHIRNRMIMKSGRIRYIATIVGDDINIAKVKQIS